MGSEGAYSLKLSTQQGGDQDVYGVDLKVGDVIGATVTGSGHHLSIYDSAGTELMGSTIDASGSYSPASPLPGGGNATAQMLGVGADGIGGTADDVDVDFTTDPTPRRNRSPASRTPSTPQPGVQPRARLSTEPNASSCTGEGAFARRLDAPGQLGGGAETRTSGALSVAAGRM